MNNRNTICASHEVVAFGENWHGVGVASVYSNGELKKNHPFVQLELKNITTKVTGSGSAISSSYCRCATENIFDEAAKLGPENGMNLEIVRQAFAGQKQLAAEIRD